MHNKKPSKRIRPEANHPNKIRALPRHRIQIRNLQTTHRK